LTTSRRVGNHGGQQYRERVMGVRIDAQTYPREKDRRAPWGADAHPYHA